MANPVSVIEQIQLDMVGRAQAHPPFANVPIMNIRPRDEQGAVLIQTNLDKVLAGYTSLGGKNGAAIIIQLPSGSIPNQEVTGPDFQLTYVARVFENPVVNMGATGTGISAEDLMLLLLNLYHRWWIGNLGRTMLADKRPFEPVLDYLAKGQIVYDCIFTVRMGIAGMPKTSLPKISVADGNVTITASADASVYYTTDDSYPFSGNTAATLYAGPFAAVSDTDVRAVAYADNKQASDCAFNHIP